MREKKRLTCEGMIVSLLTRGNIRGNSKRIKLQRVIL